MKISQKLASMRKAITGAVMAGAGALVVACQEVAVNGQVVDPAFHVTAAEWGTVLGAVVAALGAVYAIKNKAVNQDGTPEVGMNVEPLEDDPV